MSLGRRLGSGYAQLFAQCLSFSGGQPQGNGRERRSIAHDAAGDFTVPSSRLVTSASGDLLRLQLVALLITSLLWVTSLSTAVHYYK